MKLLIHFYDTMWIRKMMEYFFPLLRPLNTAMEQKMALMGRVSHPS